MGDLNTPSQGNIRTILFRMGAIVVVGILLFMLLLPTFQGVRSGRRYLSKNNLKMIGLAFHNYYDEFSTFPDEASGQSWATQMLPYLDHAPLNNAMDHSKPWNDPANDIPTKQTIEALTNPKYHQRFNSRGYGLSHYSGNSNWLVPGSVINIPGVTDGISNTILAGEVADGFMPWAQPGNLRDPALGINTGLNSFGSQRREGVALFLLGDGSVRYLSKDVDSTVLKALSTPAGGEVIPPESLP